MHRGRKSELQEKKKTVKKTKDEESVKFQKTEGK